MTFQLRSINLALAVFCCCGCAPSAIVAQTKSAPATAAEKKQTTDEDKVSEPIIVKVADGNIEFRATGEWKMVPPKSRMLEAEIKIPKTGNDKQDGRLTIMGAGGTIEANVVRWQGQFAQPDGSDTSDKTKVEEKKISDQTVHLVDITGTFLDSPGGPFSGQAKVERENYRMLAAIIETEDKGNYFVKFYGPKATVDKNAKAFKEMIESFKMAD